MCTPGVPGGSREASRRPSRGAPSRGGFWGLPGAPQNPPWNPGRRGAFAGSGEADPRGTPPIWPTPSGTPDLDPQGYQHSPSRVAYPLGIDNPHRMSQAFSPSLVREQSAWLTLSVEPHTRPPPSGNQPGEGILLRRCCPSVLPLRYCIRMSLRSGAYHIGVTQPPVLPTQQAV